MVSLWLWRWCDAQGLCPSPASGQCGTCSLAQVCSALPREPRSVPGAGGGDESPVSCCWLAPPQGSWLCQLTDWSNSPKSCCCGSLQGVGSHLLDVCSESRVLRFGQLWQWQAGRALRGRQNTNTLHTCSLLLRDFKCIQELTSFPLLSSAHSFPLPAHWAAEQCGPQRGRP